MIRSKGEAGTGNVVEATRHMRAIRQSIRELASMDPDELYARAKDMQAPYELVRSTAEAGRLPVVLFTAGGPRHAGRCRNDDAAGRGRGVRRLGNLQERRPIEAGARDRRGDYELPRCGHAGRRIDRPRRTHGRHRDRADSRERATLNARLVSTTIGVLALQGGFREHVAALRALGAETREVRTPDDLTSCAGLVLPGGESTTIAMLLASSGLDERLPAFPGPILGTCAGMITIAAECVDGRPGQRGLGLIDVGVRRNGYGRQARSFEASVELSDGSSMVGVFIRAPRFDRIGSNVDVIARLGDEPVAVAQGRFIATAFHPELAGDSRIHERFLKSLDATAPLPI